MQSPLRTIVVIGLAVITAEGITSVPAAAAQPPPSNENLIRLAEAFTLAERLGPGIWPGFSVSESSVVLIEGESEYLLNAHSAPADFEVVPAARFRDRPMFSRTRIFPPGLEASFPAIGRETVVIGTPEATGRKPADWILIVAHELFHVYQAANGLQSKVDSLRISEDQTGQWQLDYPFPYKDDRISDAMHIVGHQLYLLLESDVDRNYRVTLARETLRNLTTVLELAFPDQKHAEYLKFVTTKEGAARYFEYRLAEVAASQYEPTEDLAMLDGVDLFEQAWKSRYVSLPFQIKHLGRVSKSRLEFYNLGLGISLVLDQIDPNWKDDYHRPERWLDDILLNWTAPPDPAG